MVTGFSDWKRTTLALLLFGIAFGYVEAAAAHYLGTVYEPVRKRFYPDSAPSDVFPLLTLKQVQEAGPEYLVLLKTELVREFATLLMLAAAALAVSRNTGHWLAAFLIAFGTWDISFYASLKVLSDWPDSLLTWDLLFLIPVPWAAPVLAPILVSVTMIGSGFVYLTREWNGRPVRLGPLHWFGFTAAGLLLILAFTWDFRNTSAGGIPQSFAWLLFGVGEALGVGAYLHALTARAEL